jgi:acetylornithine deacetylase/succinyl-diaminopimelate desuccinylase-like protein
MYGHLDKQPEFTGWRNDLGPWTPKYEDGKLYGRGGADDGYAVYASIAAVQALKSQNVPHPRIVGLDRNLRRKRLTTTCCPISTC